MKRMGTAFKLLIAVSSGSILVLLAGYCYLLIAASPQLDPPAIMSFILPIHSPRSLDHRGQAKPTRMDAKA